MNPTSKLEVLGGLSRFDACGYPGIFSEESADSFIYPAVGEKGRISRLFKVLQTNICEGNCLYCANRKDRNFPRYSFKPDELARLFMEEYKKGSVDGLFLSSAILKDATYSEERMLQTLKLVRKRYRYPGYIHFKILPGVDKGLVEEAAKFADRLSINLEAPKERYLVKLSPTKNFYHQLLKGLSDIFYVVRKNHIRAGITTQLVVGAAGESDQEILKLSCQLYQNYGLRRIYYKAFSPVEETPLEDTRPCPLLRELRLYQAGFLLKYYFFKPEELSFEKGGNLPLNHDPKLAWAYAHPEFFPIEINKGSYRELLRIPGIGRIGAKKILEVRKKAKLKDLTDLRKLKVMVRRVRNFITISGRLFPERKKERQKVDERQLFLWEEL
ncbi:MAG: radical SAM protein [Candidatus Omnitrophica bacterium]|nr:radical SAM protein [Candidatus Omnitrophota bacterium]